MPNLTGYYIDEDDLKPYMPSEELTAITETIDTQSGETNVQMAIINACSIADTYLQNHYDLPLAASLKTEALKGALAKIVVWEISGNYSSISEEVRRIREKNYDDAMNYLRGLADGSIHLIDEGNDTNEADKYYADSNQRIQRNFY